MHQIHFRSRAPLWDWELTTLPTPPSWMGREIPSLAPRLEPFATHCHFNHWPDCACVVIMCASEERNCIGWMYCRTSFALWLYSICRERVQSVVQGIIKSQTKTMMLEWINNGWTSRVRCGLWIQLLSLIKTWLLKMYVCFFATKHRGYYSNSRFALYKPHIKMVTMVIILHQSIVRNKVRLAIYSQHV